MSDSEKVKYIIDCLEVTPHGFARLLGEEKATKIYAILTEKNKLSVKMAEKILAFYPNINKKWLLGSDEKPFLTGEHPIRLEDENVVREIQATYKAKCRDCEFKDREIDLLTKQVESLEQQNKSFTEWIAELREDKRNLENNLRDLRKLTGLQEKNVAG